MTLNNSMMPTFNLPHLNPEADLTLGTQGMCQRVSVGRFVVINYRDLGPAKISS